MVGRPERTFPARTLACRYVVGKRRRCRLYVLGSASSSAGRAFVGAHGPRTGSESSGEDLAR